MTDALRLRETYSHPSHRPLIEHVADKGGLRLVAADASDATGAIDPLELAYQRGAADLARGVIRDLGWTLELQPPPSAKPVDRQTEAQS